MKHDEQGIALVIVIFLMGTLSALAVSMMFLAQTETASSRNYRTMSQARYAAEAGVHQTTNYLMYTYSPPASPFTGYDPTKSPVTCTSGCTHNQASTCTPTTIALAVSTGCIVVGYSTATSNNPAGTVNSGASGTLAVNGLGKTNNAAMGTVTYGAVAILMSMRSVTPYGTTGTSVIQTWQIVSDGTVPPSTAAIVEVSGSLEREFGDAETYAVFATGSTCGAITMSGNASTNSYDSSAALVSGSPVISPSGGDVGTNGNLTITGSVDAYGTLSTPRTGAGTCNNGAVDALTSTGSATVHDGIIQLPQTIAFPTPTAPSPTNLTTSSISSSTATCAGAGITVTLPSLCTAVGGVVTITTNGGTVSIGNLTMNGGTLNIVGGTSTAATVNINSITLGGNANLTLGTGTTVTMNVGGQTSTGYLATPIDLTGGADINPSLDASRLQILYAGTGEIKLTGGNTISATIYAPNASADTHGNGQFYGSILSSTFTDAGNTNFHYDRNLQKKFQTLGNYMMTSFSWKKY